MKKTIIIGATSGIGRELAKLYSARGWEVGITGRRTELLKSLAEDLQTRTYDLTLDIQQTAEAQASLQRLIQEMNGVDLIIISAGTGHLNEDLEWEMEQDTIDTNVTGFAAIANTAMKHFSDRGSGHLVGISSIAAIRGSDVAPAYNASKAFVSNYLEGLRKRCAKRNLPIAITDVQPGLVDTDMAKGEGLFWVAPAEEAAKQIFRAVERKKKRVYVTKRWGLIALLLRILPDCIYNRM